MGEQDYVFEQRNSERHTLVNFAWYHIIGEPHDQARESREGVARSCDVSQTGAGIMLPGYLPADSHVFLEIVSTAGNLSVVGRVMHCRQSDSGFYRAGIHFEIVPPTDHMTLARIVSQ